LTEQGRSQAIWDEATLLYNEEQSPETLLGTYTLIFRVRHLIAFVSNRGAASMVSTRDTEELTRAILERLRAFQ
jgi:hypothetical protein